MTDTKAIENLNNLISEISGLRRNSTEHARWLANVLRVLDEKFGADSQYSTTIRSFSWKERRQVQGFIAGTISNHKESETIRTHSGARWGKQKVFYSQLLMR